MMQVVVKRRPLNKSGADKEDIVFWLQKTPQERVATVDFLRKQYHGSTARLQRVARVIQRTPR